MGGHLTLRELSSFWANIAGAPGDVLCPKDLVQLKSSFVRPLLGGGGDARRRRQA